MKQIYILEPRNYAIYYVNIDLCHQYGIPSLRLRCSYWRNIPSGEEQGETVVFAGQDFRSVHYTPPLAHFRISIYFISYQVIVIDVMTKVLIEKIVGKKLIDGSKE